MNSRPHLISIRQADFGYGGRAVVRVNALQLLKGRCLGIFGPNGAGKTTLVRGMTGLLSPTAGDVSRSTGIRIGYLSQYRSIDTHWPMSGFDAAAMASSALHAFGRISATTRRRIIDAMARLDVQTLAGSSFGELSGGQQQRVLLAGALAAEPQVLVLDEPTDGLDVRSRDRLIATLKELTAGGLCTVIISHDVEDLLAASHEVAWLHPADAPGRPSHVELLPPSKLAERLVAGRLAV